MWWRSSATAHDSPRCCSLREREVEQEVAGIERDLGVGRQAERDRPGVVAQHARELDLGVRILRAS